MSAGEGNFGESFALHVKTMGAHDPITQELSIEAIAGQFFVPETHTNPINMVDQVVDDSCSNMRESNSYMVRESVVHDPQINLIPQEPNIERIKALLGNFDVENLDVASESGDNEDHRSSDEEAFEDNLPGNPISSPITTVDEN